MLQSFETHLRFEATATSRYLPSTTEPSYPSSPPNTTANSAHALPEDAIPRDEILADVSVYWFTGTAGSAANLYYEAMHGGDWPTPSGVPTGVAVFAEDVAIRRYAERANNIVHWSDFETGGHFAALETPGLLAGDIRAFFASLAA